MTTTPSGRIGAAFAVAGLLLISLPLQASAGLGVDVPTPTSGGGMSPLRLDAGPVEAELREPFPGSREYDVYGPASHIGGWLGRIDEPQVHGVDIDVAGFSLYSDITGGDTWGGEPVTHAGIDANDWDGFVYGPRLFGWRTVVVPLFVPESVQILASHF